MAPSRYQVLLALANLLIPAAVLVFAKAFFPYKPFLPGLAEYQVLDYGDPPPAPFDKVVFMVVDALRSDFVYSPSSGFKFTQSLIRNGAAIPFTAHATSPTITMPRVKAMTTGSIPSFLDVILNFAESDTTSTLAHQDTWLAQMKAKDGKLVMYGDDTWLKLFPDTFSRADGTSSFFVSDFTQVDNNVTRHVPGELREKDWNAMIMHYLGLDHIGHKAGPLSPNMYPKQVEMDGIVQQVYEAMETQSHLQNTLLVVAGDHGMNDGGNHGGSAPGETSPALVFLSPKFKVLAKQFESPTSPREEFEYYSMVEQSDLVPTIAGLLGFPVPLNNLGVFVEDFLPLWSKDDDRVQLLLRNAMQMLTIVKATFSYEAFENPYATLDCSDPLSSGHELACKWRRVTDIFRATGGAKPAAAVILPAIQDFCKHAQEIMSSTASNYNIPLLITGIILSGISLALSLAACKYQTIKPLTDLIPFALLIILYSIMMFASSYVEEEQHFWYWATTGWIIYLYTSSTRFSPPSKSLPSLTSPAFSALIVLSLHRLSTRWNQTGQKHAGAPDIVSTILTPYPPILWTLVAITYLTVFLRLSRSLAPTPTSNPTTPPNSAQESLRSFGATSAAAALVLPAFAFKVAFTAKDAPELVGAWVPGALEAFPLVRGARVVFWGVGVGVVWVVGRAKWGGVGKKETMTALQDLLTVFLLTQTRTVNIPSFLIFTLQAHFLSPLLRSQPQSQPPSSNPPKSPSSSPPPPPTTKITLTLLLLTHTAFFATGNSNAISSIDLSNAYNGTASYNVVGVGLLVFLGNWAGAVWWFWWGLARLCGGEDEDEGREGRKGEGGGRMTTARKWIEEERAQLRSSVSASSSPRASQTTANPPSHSPYTLHLTLTTIYTSASLTAVMLACTVLRQHLFIWTVFSPKYLFAMAWAVAFHGILGVGVGGLVVGFVG
ncbi:alkaline phosphatase-like protein [Aulographum hederae CBS 113979]|uniref:GPI ethanolamine phosphate transferase 2 n=1 Tax=Aulographum hederae CBS 113979 TaxID=1176131 RepID=A0A6G1GY78_9PEZI|nr:alkaline phosphatase-like protein [Aulographum hederae CBS 113979]